MSNFSIHRQILNKLSSPVNRRLKYLGACKIWDDLVYGDHVEKRPWRSYFCCHAHVWGLIAQNPRHQSIWHLLTSKVQGLMLLRKLNLNCQQLSSHSKKARQYGQFLPYYPNFQRPHTGRKCMKSTRLSILAINLACMEYCKIMKF